MKDFGPIDTIIIAVALCLIIQTLHLLLKVIKRYRDAQLGFMLWKRGIPPAVGWWWLRGPGVNECIVHVWYSKELKQLINTVTLDMLPYGNRSEDYEHAGPVPYPLEENFRE